MNDLMKNAVAATGLPWTATVPLVLFFGLFVGAVVWSLAHRDEAPDWEV